MPGFQSQPPTQGITEANQQIHLHGSTLGLLREKGLENTGLGLYVSPLKNNPF